MQTFVKVIGDDGKASYVGLDWAHGDPANRRRGSEDGNRVVAPGGGGKHNPEADDQPNVAGRPDNPPFISVERTKRT